MTESLDWDALWDEDEQRYRVQTKDGRKVRIWTSDAYSARCPIRGEICYGGRWEPAAWFDDGRMPGDVTDAQRLVPEPRTVRRWVNVYRTGDDCRGTGRLYRSERDAQMHTNAPENDHIATVPIEWEE